MLKKVDNLIEELLQARKNVELAKRQLEANKESEEEIENKLVKEFAKSEIKSKKYEDKTVRMTHSEYVKVLDEESVIKQLRERNIGGMTKVKLETVKFKKFAKEEYIKTKKLFKDTELVSKNSITIK